MTFLEQAKTQIITWSASMDAADHMTLLAIGLGLIIVSVFSLIMQNVLAKRSSRQVERQGFEPKKPSILGERHMVQKTRKKEDVFLRRLDSLA